MASDQVSLHLLVRWCQLIGLSPFRMERHPSTGRFRRFAFSWRHPLTCWWLYLNVLVSGLLFYVLRNQWSLPLNWASPRPKLIVDTIRQIVQLYLPLVGTFRCKALAKTSRYLREFDRFTANHSVPPCPARKRTAIAIVFTLISVNKSKKKVFFSKQVFFSFKHCPSADRAAFAGPNPNAFTEKRFGFEISALGGLDY